MIKLHSYYRSSAAYRVRIALELKNLNWETIPVNLRIGEQNQKTFLEYNPQGLVPVLESNGHYLSQSLAIIEFLEEMYPEKPLLPNDIVERSQVRRFAQQIAIEIHHNRESSSRKYQEDAIQKTPY